MAFKRTVFFSARLCLTAFLFWQLIGRVAADNMLEDLNNFDDTPLIDNPWGLVQDGEITMQGGSQNAVDDDGHVTWTQFGPGIAIGDLNGDGLPDLVVADSRGYFWFFPNSGTPKVPKFTTGEIMPIWIGDPTPPGDQGFPYFGIFDKYFNTVPRIQLVDYAGEKKLSLLVGNFEGKLFYIHNIGTPTQPAFQMPEDLASITVDTHSDGLLWCNFLSPFLADLTGNGQLDLIMGEGTYASNSIYRLINKGSNSSPTFNETNMTKIIPGFGREHLTPQVVDWNNDGKPDIISGERQGYIDIFLNKTTDPSHLVFDNPPPPAAPPHVMFGSTDQLGILTTVAVGDLTGNKLPNLLISNADERLLYAVNKGKLGAPAFDFPQTLKGVNPFPKVFAPPDGWKMRKDFAMPYVLMACTNKKDDPNFESPDGKIQSALKIYTVPHQHVYFKNEIFPDDDTHSFVYDEGIPIQAGVHYTTSFWIKTSGDVSNVCYVFCGQESLAAQGGKGTRYNVLRYPVDTGSSWTHFVGDTYLEKADPDKDDTSPMALNIGFNGNGGTVEVTGFSMSKR